MHCPLSIEANPRYLRWLHEHRDLETEAPEIVMATMIDSEKEVQLDTGQVEGGAVDDDMIYQSWQYSRHVKERIEEGKILDLIHSSDPASSNATGPVSDLLIEGVGLKKLPISSSFRCRRCRYLLGASSSLLPHKSSSSTNTECAHLFFQDPLSWMQPELEKGKLEGRLDCPNKNCRGIVGKYAWQGVKCRPGLFLGLVSRGGG